MCASDSPVRWWTVSNFAVLGHVIAGRCASVAGAIIGRLLGSRRVPSCGIARMLN
ncbi:MAG TPA: hypothetical protein VJS16_05405 [Gammaproteobacteria bacterium]|nr:hypothetical protein [Gammaproteobacteria bacterium]